ncbi:fabH [Symbiodinium natans]|uniref:FabH protein n=1 Tax=Symbiodinium natans TaxID=878477 RepID=A0A812PYK5_9DINO|nr:fabH [Symbiodinium natans]
MHSKFHLQRADRVFAVNLLLEKKFGSRGTYTFASMLAGIHTALGLLFLLLTSAFAQNLEPSNRTSPVRLVSDLEGQILNFTSEEKRGGSDPSASVCGPSFCFDKQTANCFQKMPANVCMKAIYMCVKYILAGDMEPEEFCGKERANGNSDAIEALAAPKTGREEKNDRHASSPERLGAEPTDLWPSALWGAFLISFLLLIVIRHFIHEPKKEITPLRMPLLICACTAMAYSEPELVGCEGNGTAHVKMPGKMRPDFLIQKRIQKDNQFAVAADYASKMAAISQVTHWFEGKQKFDFAETEKRSSEFIKQEMNACSEELKIRRRTRLRNLYEAEAKAYEAELASLGLAVQCFGVGVWDTGTVLEVEIGHAWCLNAPRHGDAMHLPSWFKIGLLYLGKGFLLGAMPTCFGGECEALVAVKDGRVIQKANVVTFVVVIFMSLFLGIVTVTMILTVMIVIMIARQFLTMTMTMLMERMHCDKLREAQALAAPGLCGAVAAGRQRRRLRALPFGISVVGTGSAAPDTVVSNDDLAEIVETSDEWISQRTGIRRRHVLAPDESLASLSAKAATRALEAAKMSAEDIELVIHATSTPDDLFGTGPKVASMLGADKAVAFDLTAACSGFVFALTTAAQYVRSGAYKSAVVIGADCLSRWVDWSDRNTCVLFGDGAGAVVITATDVEKDALIGFHMGSDGNGSCHLGLLAETDGVSLGSGKEGGTGTYQKVGMNGKEVFRFATSRAPETLSRLMEKHNISGEEVDWLLLHQANRRIMDSAARRLKLPKEKILCNLDEYGNTSAASIPLALDEDGNRRDWGPTWGLRLGMGRPLTP